MKVAGYVRVSRVAGREGDTFISPSSQRDRIIAWAKAGGHELVGVFEDLDQPGSRLERPGLTEAMALVESGGANGIVVAKLDRFTRSVAHLGGMLERLRAVGGHLVAVEQGIDTSTSTGKLIADILGAISEWELERIRDNWNVARGAAVERGVHVTGTVPLGFRRRDGYRPGSGEAPPVPADARFELEPGEVPLVREVFRKRAIKTSWKRIAAWLGEQTGRSWSIGAVRNMVANRVYLGEASAGGGLVKVGAHPAIVNRELFEAANQAQGVAPGRSGRSSGLLSGVLRCAGCRYAMKPSHRVGYGIEYRCKAASGQAAGGPCPAPCSISAHLVEPYVLDAFWEFVGDYKATGYGEETAALDEARTELATAENELAALLDQRLAEVLREDPEGFTQMVRDRRRAVEEAEARVTELAYAGGPQAELLFSEVWPELEMYEKRQLLASAFACIFVRRTPGGRGGETPIEERIWFGWRGEPTPELPVRGKRWTPEPFEFDRLAPGGAESESR